MSIADRLKGRSDKEYHNPILGVRLRYPPDVNCEEVPLNPSVTMVAFIRGEAMVQLNAFPMTGQDLDGTAKQSAAMVREQLAPSGLIPVISPVDKVVVFSQQIEGREFTVTAGEAYFKTLLIVQNKNVFSFQRLSHTKASIQEAENIWERIQPTIEFFEPEIPLSPISSVIWKEYYNDQFDFGLKFPVDWKLETSSSPKKPVIFTYTEKEVRIIFTVSFETIPTSMTLSEYWKILQTQYRKAFMIIPQPTNTKLNNKPALQTITSPADNMEVFQRFTVFQGKSIQLTCECHNAIELKLLPLLDRMMDSFGIQHHPLGKDTNQFEMLIHPMTLNYSSQLSYNQEMGALLYLEHQNYPSLNFELQILIDDPNYNPLGFSVKNIDEVYRQVLRSETSGTDASIISQIAINSSLSSKKGREVTLAGSFHKNQLCKKVIRILPTNDGSVLLTFAAPEEQFLKLWTDFGFDLMNNLKYSN